MNGFNEKVDQAELRDDMQHALDEFNAASGTDTAFVEAKIGALSCLGFLVFSDPQHDLASPQAQELLARARQLRKEIEAAAPENPRFLWVMGPMIWYAPADRGGGQDKAMAGYEKGLESSRKPAKAASDPLEPSWGAGIADESCMVEPEPVHASAQGLEGRCGCGVASGFRMALRKRHFVATNPGG